MRCPHLSFRQSPQTAKDVSTDPSQVDADEISLFDSESTGMNGSADFGRGRNHGVCKRGRVRSIQPSESVTILSTIFLLLAQYSVLRTPWLRLFQPSRPNKLKIDSPSLQGFKPSPDSHHIRVIVSPQIKSPTWKPSW